MGLANFRQQQKEHPEYFLYSAEEGETLKTAYNALFEVLSRYSQGETEGPEAVQAEARIEKIKGEALAEFEKLGLSPKLLKSLCGRAKDKKNWTFGILGPDGAGHEVIEYISNSKKYNGKITYEKHPAFYNEDATVKEQAAEIGIPDNYLFVIPAENGFAYEISIILSDNIIAPQNGFFTTKSSPFFSAFGDIGRRRIESAKHDEKLNAVTIEANEAASLQMPLMDFNEGIFESPAFDKILKLLQAQAYNCGYSTNTYTLSLSQYLEKTKESDNPDRREASTTLKSFIKWLKNAAFEVESPDGSYGFVHYAQKAVYISNKRNGRAGSFIRVCWSDEYIQNEIQTQQYIRRPEKILLIPNYKRNSYWIATAFSEQKRRNIGKWANIENKLSVSKLLDKCTFPTYESLKKKSQAGQKIISKFIDAMDFLVEFGIFSSWKFAHGGSTAEKEALTDAELERVEVDYNLFITLNVVITWAQEPDYSHLTERKKQQQEKINTPPKKRGRPRKNPQPE